MTGATQDGIAGLWVALATPLDAAGGVDHAAFAAHATGLIARGVDGVVAFGTTGEGTAFSASEKLAAVEALLAAGIVPARIGLGTGSPAIPDAVALTRAALDLGLVHALVLPPYYDRSVTAEGIEAAFAAIVEGVGDDRLRLTLYHIPQTSGVAVPPAVAASLRARYGRVVAGLKDSSGDFESFRAFRAAAPELAITVGSEKQIGRALAEGGTGTICGLANVVPELVRDMFGASDAEAPMSEAQDLFAGAFVPTLKAALAAMHDVSGWAPGWARVRPPLVSADAATGVRVAAALRAIGRRRAA